MINLYAILEITKTANDSEIKKAYKRLALKYHPDKGGDSEKFKKISDAYTILSDKIKRQEYDNRDNIKNNMNGEDIFSNFFFNRKSPQQNKNNMTYTIELSLEEIYKGLVKKMAINRDVICGKCSGLGCSDKSKIQICNICNGKRFQIFKRQVAAGITQEIRQQCGKCRGDGKLIDHAYICNQCNGKKTIKEKIIKNINIPKGVENDDCIILPQCADERPNAITGDILFIIKEKSHPTFKRKGNNLLMETEIDLADALCGAKIQIKHLDGKSYYIETGDNDIISPNEFKAVENFGMPVKDSNNFGHLAILFKVKFPKRITKIQKKLLVNIFNHTYRETDSENTKQLSNINEVEFNEPLYNLRYTTDSKETVKCTIM